MLEGLRQMKRSLPYFAIVPAIFIALGFLIIPKYILLGREEVEITKERGKEEIISLEPGKIYLIDFSIPSNVKQVAGFVLKAKPEPWNSRKIWLRIFDQSGKELAKTENKELRYSDPRLTILQTFKPFAANGVGKLTAEIKIEGSPLALSLAEAEGQKASFVGENFKKDRIPVFSILTPEPLSVGVQRGIIAGLIFLIGALVIYFLKSEKNKWICSAILLALAVPIALWGFMELNKWGISDWDYYFSVHHGYREAIIKYHQFPLWNPITAGGTAALGDPEFSVFSITYLLELFLGVPLGLRLAIFLTEIIGAWGMLALSRRLRLSPEAGLLAATAYAFGTVNLLEIVEGHVNIFNSMWIPWIFWAWLGMYRKKNSPLLCGIFLAATFYAGGIYLLMYTAIAFVLLSFFTHHPFQAIKRTVQAGLWSLGLASFKLFPVLFWLKEYSDESYASSANTLGWLKEIFLGRFLHGAEVIYQQGSGWHEYGAYIGFFVLLLAILGAFRFKKRIVFTLILAAVIAVLISASGPTLKPFFDKFPYMPRSNISRFVLFAILPITLLAGLGLDLVKSKKNTNWLVPSLIGLVALDLMTLAYPLSQMAFVLDPALESRKANYPIEYTGNEYKTEHGGASYSRSYAAILAGYGSIAFPSILGPNSAVRLVSDENDSFVRLIGEGDAKINYWSPNKIIVETKAAAPAKIILNENYGSGWTANDRPAEQVDNLLAAPIDKGSSTITFEFTPKGMWVGLIISIVTIFLAVYLRKRKEQK